MKISQCKWITLKSISKLKNRTSFCRKRSFLEKLIFSFSFLTFFLSSFLILYGYSFSTGFKKLSLIIFYIGFLFIFLYVFKNRRRIYLFLLDGIKKLFSGDFLNKIFFLIFILFLAKLILFCLFKPVIDSDCIDSYFPFARSIFLADRIPGRNYYDNRIMIFPPIGSAVIYAWVYSLMGNIFSEAFRILPVIYIIGIIIATYKIAEFIIGKDLAKLSLIIFLLFPVWDEYFFESLFYPDIIALFLFLSFFYVFLKENYFSDINKKNLVFYLFISSFLGTILFFKVQYFIAYYFLGLLFLIYFLPSKWWGNLFLILGVIPILYRLKRGVGYSLNNHFLVIIFAIFVYLLSIYIFNKRGKIKFNFLTIFLVFFGFLIGFLPHLRNQLLYGSFLIPVKNSYLPWQSGVLKAAKISSFSNFSFLEWVIFVFPAFGIFWLIPKIFGIKESLKNEKTIIILLFILVWYAIITLLFGEPNYRSLLPVFPFLSILITLGIEKIINLLKVNSLNFKKAFILLSIIFSLFNSTFLWWNSGLILFNGSGLRKVLNIKTLKDDRENRRKIEGRYIIFLKDTIPRSTREEINKKISKIISQITDLSLILTARDEFYQKYFWQLTALTIISSFLLIILSYFLAKISLSFKTLAILIFSFYLLPYLLTFFVIPKGKIWEFKKVEAEELYNYWGQQKIIVPYLKENAKKEDKIVFWGISTGLSYYTNLRVYNLLYSYSLGEIFKEIFYEKDLDKIYKFYKDNGFSYFILSTYPDPYSNFLKIKKITKIFDIFENKKYATLVIKPSEECFWKVYKLK